MSLNLTSKQKQNNQSQKDQNSQINKSNEQSNYQFQKQISEYQIWNHSEYQPIISSINEENLIVNNIDFNDKYVLFATNKGFRTFSLKYKNLMKQQIFLQNQNIWQAIFIPESYYIAYVVNNTRTIPNSRQTLYLYNHKNKMISAKLKITEQIQTIKSSKGCIILRSLQNLYALHFPTLKPIYNGPAGNGIRINFDLSYEGLTIAHDSYIKGELVIKNFTNIKANQALQERKKSIISSKKSDTLRRMTTGQKSNSLNIFQSKKQFNPIMKLKAHKQNLTIIKMSPNGLKVVTASNTGTILRIFSTKNGQKIEQFRIGYQITKIVDVKFKSSGNFIGVLTIKGQIHLYHVKIQEQQKKKQSQRLGYGIYTQQNPKSFFSFLSFLFPHLNDGHHFNYFQLQNPQLKKKINQMQEKIKKVQNQNKDKNRIFAKQNQNQELKSNNLFKKNTTMYESQNPIRQVEQEHYQNENNNNEKNQKNKQKYQIRIIQKQKQNNFQSVEKISSPFNLLPQDNKLSFEQRSKFYKSLSPSRNNLNQLKSQNQIIKRSVSHKQSLKNYLRQNSRMSIKTRNKLKQQQKQKNKKQNYNLVNKFFITQSNYIWIVKGFYLYGLKYDPFHGGQMVLDRTFKIK